MITKPGLRCFYFLLIVILLVGCVGQRIPTVETKKTSPILQYTYDPNGNVKTRTDANGHKVEYEYDSQNQLISVKYPDKSVISFEYDALGQRTKMTDSVGITTYGYDIHGRLVNLTDPNKNTLQYAYDPRGLVTQMIYPDGSVSKFTWNANGYLSAVTDASGTTNYQYDSANNIRERTLPNGVITRYQYDKDNRLTRIQHISSNGDLIIGFDYQLDAAGNRTQVTQTDTQGTQVTRYVYDSLYQLVQVNYPDGEEVTYKYDATGNRTNMNSSKSGETKYKYNTLGQLTALTGPEGKVTFSYDANGNLVEQKNKKERLTNRYTWDYENKLIGFNNGSAKVFYSYDGDGNRIKKSVDGKTTLFVNNVNGFIVQTVSEVKDDGETKNYFYGVERLSQIDSEGIRSFYLNDSLEGSICSLIDNLGRISDSFKYEVFGKITSETGESEKSYSYNGEYADGETGLLFLRNRYYDPVIGRFLSRDIRTGSLGNPQSLNLYVFVRNNPVNFIDPFGLEDYKRGSLLPVVLNAAVAVVAFSTGNIFLGAYSTFSLFLAWHNYIGTNFAPDPYNIEYQHPIDTSKFLFSLAAYSLQRPPKEIQLWELTGSVLNLVIGIWSYKGSTLDDLSLAYDTSDYIWENTIQPTISLWKKGSDNNESTLIGGVSLDKAAEVLVNLNDISGATYDPKTGQMILFGRKDLSLPPMNMDDLVVAIRAIYDGSENPGVTMYPVDPNMQDITQKVEYYGQTKNTHFGSVMFEADRYLKSLAAGVDTLTGQPVTPNVPGYKSEMDLGVELQTDTPWHRNWFVPGEIVIKQSEDGQTMVFDKADIILQSRFFEFLPDGSRQDIQGSSPVTDQFTKFMGEHYNEFAATKPELAKLVQLAKIVGFVRWLHDNNIPVDLSWVNDYQVAYVETPTTTPGVVVKRSYETSITSTSTWTSMGGVDYDTDNSYLEDTDGKTGQLAEEVIVSRPSDYPVSWDFKSNGEMLTAVAFNMTPTEITGSYSTSVIDLEIPSVYGDKISFNRKYNSLDLSDGILGSGWKQVIPELNITIGPDPDNPNYNLAQAIIRTGNNQQKYSFGSSGTFFTNDINASSDVLGVTSGDKFTPIGIPNTYYPSLGSSGQLMGIKDDEGNSMDFSGFALVKQDGSVFAFNQDGHIIAQRNAQGQTLNYLYKNGQLTSIMDSAKNSIGFTYDSTNRLTGITASTGQAVHYSYNSSNLLISVTDETGTQIVSYTYGTDNRLNGISDLNGQHEDLAYDGLGRVIASNSPAGNWNIAYNDLTNNTTYTDSNGNVITRQYDDKKRLLSETIAGASTSYQYNDKNDITSITDFNGNATNYNYDKWGNLSEIVSPLGTRTVLSGYNELGLPETLIDPNQGITLYQYDEQGRVISVESGLRLNKMQTDGRFNYREVDSQVTHYSYDTSGNLASIQDTSGSITQYSYDLTGNLITVKFPNGGEIQQTFDDLSHLTSVTDPTGYKMNFGYDEQGQIVNISTSSGQTQYQYSNGLVSAVIDPLKNTTNYAYNEEGQLINVTDSNGSKTTYEYDDSGNLSAVIDPSGQRVEYQYDMFGRLLGIYR